VTPPGTPFAVYLFDIDGTLVNAAGAGRRAFERAVAEHCGPVNGALAGLRLDGMTDRLIVREALKLLGRPFDDGLCDRLLGRYVEHLRGELQGPGYACCPGSSPRSRRSTPARRWWGSAPGTSSTVRA